MKKPSAIQPQLQIKCQADPATNEGTMELNGFIDSWGWEDDSLPIINAQIFQKKFNELAATSNKINIKIGSLYGGSVYEGLAIFNTIAQSKVEVHTFNNGLAASMGAMIWLAGSTRHMCDAAQLMIHAPWGGVWGNAAQIRAYADDLDKLAAILSEIINKNTTKGMDAVNEIMSKDSFMSLAECQEWGFVDVAEKYEGHSINADAVASMNHKQAFEYYAKMLQKDNRKNPSFFASILNKLFPNQNQKAMITLSTGDASIYIDAETEPAVGDAVYSDEAMTITVDDGTYTIVGGNWDGYTIVTASGLITELNAPAASEEQNPPAADAEAQARIQALEKQNRYLAAQLKKAGTEHTSLPVGKQTIVNSPAVKQKSANQLVYEQKFLKNK